MKVLRQDWNFLDGRQITSISKDQEQLNQTIKEVAPTVDPKDDDFIMSEDEALEPDGEPQEMDIPDDSVFIDMIERRTVFINEDEMRIIWDNMPDDS